jgi:hypothetical protein
MVRNRYRCDVDGCRRFATRARAHRQVLPPFLLNTDRRCDEHSDTIHFVEDSSAPLIRETETFIAEAHDRPSVRAMPTGGDR